MKIPKLIQKLFSSCTWSKPTSEKVIYITFDDGPHPEITPWVLQQLNMCQAKASFFCVGENVERYPDVVEGIVAKGHTVGNHTYNHLNGWKLRTSTYVSNVDKAFDCLSRFTSRKLFRPPYGKIGYAQLNALRIKGYEIIMWDVLSGDFDATISNEKCLRNVLDNTQSGSIVVFHDSEKCFDKLQYVLPKFLNYFTEKGYRFECL